MTEKYTDPNGKEFRSKADADLYERRIKMKNSGLIGSISYFISGVFRKVFGSGPKMPDGRWNW